MLSCSSEKELILLKLQTFRILYNRPNTIKEPYDLILLCIFASIEE